MSNQMPFGLGPSIMGGSDASKMLDAKSDGGSPLMSSGAKQMNTTGSDGKHLFNHATPSASESVAAMCEVTAGK